MLDVHPPHPSAHTWKDFFIHIATIVVGLIIAVGLEQLVEHVHQRYELRETREALQHELESNRTKVAGDERSWLITTAGLKNDLLILGYIHNHPGTPETALPGTLYWFNSPFRYDHAVWDAAEKNGITRLMPLSESNRYQEFYTVLSTLEVQNVDTWNALNDARRFDLLDTDPTHLSPQQLDQVLQLAEIALEKQIEEGYSMGRLSHEFPDMPQTVTWININKFRPDPIDLDPKGLAAAQKLTDDRINATASLPPTP